MVEIEHVAAKPSPAADVVFVEAPLFRFSTAYLPKW